MDGLTGSKTCMTAIFTFAMKETPSNERTFRCGILEFSYLIAPPMASYLAGKLLPLGPWLGHQQTRNFAVLFLIAIVGFVMCFIYVALVLGKVRKQEGSQLKKASVRSEW